MVLITVCQASRNSIRMFNWVDKITLILPCMNRQQHNTYSDSCADNNVCYEYFHAADVIASVVRKSNR